VALNVMSNGPVRSTMDPNLRPARPACAALSP
jgi:hypothetical protein